MKSTNFIKWYLNHTIVDFTYIKEEKVLAKLLMDMPTHFPLLRKIVV